MKSLLFVAALYAACLGGCTKKVHQTDFSPATIEGWDKRMGPCTGGIYVLIEDFHNPNDERGYYSADMPQDLTIDELTRFPIKVLIRWKVSDKCFGNYVDILSISKR